MTDESMVNIEIDGVSLQAPKGAMVMAVADAAGIYIPRFCYHHKLSVAANCRMCLVEVAKAPKPLPACATPVTEGMKVFTRSSRAIDAQKATMEFLLINHPLDCPICDQGGECELQDLAMGFGSDVSRFSEGKRVVKDKNIGPLISTDMTRCIHCTRCVRFGQEIAGIMELGATGRGENMRIGTYVERAVASELSGNVIDLCPVGALNAKPSRMSARGWELTEHASVGPHDCVGSNVYVHTLRGEVKRVVPRDNEAVNECWIADRDRFSFAGLRSEQRLTSPMVREGDEWRQCDWETALQTAADGLRQAVGPHGGAHLGMLVSPNATVEEMWLLQHLAESLGCDNLDHRLRQWDFSGDPDMPLFPWLGQSIEELEAADAVLLVGSDVRREQPMIAHRLRKASKRGAAVMAINCRDFDFHLPQAETVVASPGGMVTALAAVARTALEAAGQAVPEIVTDLLSGAEPDALQRAMAERLRVANRGCLLLGSQAASGPHFAALQALAVLLAEATGVEFGYLSDGANAAGAWLAGILPHRGPGGDARETAGLNVRAMLESPRKAYLLHGVEPEFDCADPATALGALNTAQFVVCLTPFVTGTMRDYANVLLPMAAFGETSGTFVNVEGRWQSFAGATEPRGAARPGWKVLRVLGNLLHVSGFEYIASDQIRDDMAVRAGNNNPDNRSRRALAMAQPTGENSLLRVSAPGLYRTDGLVRRSAPLQDTADAHDEGARICARLAERLGLASAERVVVIQGNAQARMPLFIDDGVADGCVWVPAGTEASARLGAMFGPIELEAD